MRVTESMYNSAESIFNEFITEFGTLEVDAEEKRAELSRRFYAAGFTMTVKEIFDNVLFDHKYRNVAWKKVMGRWPRNTNPFAPE